MNDKLFEWSVVSNQSSESIRIIIFRTFRLSVYLHLQILKLSKRPIPLVTTLYTSLFR